jgi:hypothetical protein
MFGCRSQIYGHLKIFGTDGSLRIKVLFDPLKLSVNGKFRSYFLSLVYISKQDAFLHHEKTIKELSS